MLNDKVECFLCNHLIKDYLVLFVIEQCVLSPGIHHKEKKTHNPLFIVVSLSEPSLYVLNMRLKFEYNM